MPDIIKTDGSIEAWDEKKLYRSLVRSGATDNAAARIVSTISASIAPSEQSERIYKRAFSMLRREGRAAAARYSLRRALFELGPTGHPFEDFIAELYKTEGWEVLPRQLLKGRCVEHEVDIRAVRGDEHLAGELKYHNNPGYKTDVKVALYVKARLDDIWAGDDHKQGKYRIDHGLLVTNTKFTYQAVQFGECAGLTMLGWSYPHVGSLYDRIVAAGLYPITVLTTLRRTEKKLLIDKNIVTTELLRSHRQLLREIGVPPERIGSIVAEIETLRDTSKDVVLHHHAATT